MAAKNDRFLSIFRVTISLISDETTVEQSKRNSYHVIDPKVE